MAKYRPRDLVGSRVGLDRRGPYVTALAEDDLHLIGFNPVGEGIGRELEKGVNEVSIGGGVDEVRHGQSLRWRDRSGRIAS